MEPATIAVIGLGSMGSGMARALLAAGLPVPVTRAALERFRAASEAGLGREDDAAVAKLYAREAGLALPGGA